MFLLPSVSYPALNCLITGNSFLYLFLHHPCFTKCYLSSITVLLFQLSGSKSGSYNNQKNPWKVLIFPNANLLFFSVWKEGFSIWENKLKRKLSFLKLTRQWKLFVASKFLGEPTHFLWPVLPRTSYLTHT